MLIQMLLGFPIVEIEIQNKENKDKKGFINKDIADLYIRNGHQPTGRSRTNFSPPEFIQGKTDTPCILLLDDFNRGAANMMNGIMDLVERQEFSSWSLAPGSTIILTANPDDEDDMSFNISQLDSAQETRYLKVNMKLSISDWAEQMDKEGLDERFILFLQHHPEVVISTEKGQKKANLRIWTKFFNFVSYYKDLDKGKVLKIGSESIPESDLILFISFIQDTLSQIPELRTLLKMEDSDQMLKYLEKAIGSGTKQRVDISSIFSRRIINFVKKNKDELTKQMKSNLGKILESDYMTPDLLLLALKTKEIIEIPECSTLKIMKKMN